MNPRREFLTTLFASLDANGVRYCVLRNYDQLFEATGTDVDLLVSPYSRARFARCMHEAAAQSGYRFVQATRFANYSHVYWHPAAGFIRMDFETEVRWRLFPVLSARDILDARQPRDGFFVPHPKHESVIILSGALWRGSLSDRYCGQLARLSAASTDKTELHQALSDAFGAIGGELDEFKAHVTAHEFDREFCTRVRRSLVWITLQSGRRFLALFQNATTDLLRLIGRLRRPAGLSLLFVSSSSRERYFENLVHQVEELFPSAKCVVQSLDLTRQQRLSLGLRQHMLRLRALFKGGLFICSCRSAQDRDLSPAIRSLARCRYRSRTIVGAEDGTNRLYFGHVGTGFMTTSKPRGTTGERDFSRMFIEFATAVLEHSATQEAKPLSSGCRRGIFCVLVGLDGAGKTTLARNLCDLAARERPFAGARYFHWRPKILRPVEFPLPEFQNLPRKKAAAKTLRNTALSAVRLVKNIFLINAAYQLRLRPLLRRGFLVLVDRYFYNYYLDPVSMKYSGPSSWIECARRLLPKPDVVITLRAPKEVLIQRKQELTEAEILRQAATLETVEFKPARVIAADASRPAEEVARIALAEIVKLSS